MNEELWMTRGQTADALGITLRTVKRYMDDGTLKYRRDRKSGRVLISAESVRRYAEQTGRAVES